MGSVHVIGAMSNGNPSAITTALIALGGAIIGGLITAGGQLLAERSRANYGRAREAERLKREEEEASAARLRELVEEAADAAQRAMTFLESLRPWQLSELHQYAEGVRSALWRLALYLGDRHEVVLAYDAATQAFQRWNEVAEGSAREQSNDGQPPTTLLPALAHRQPGRTTRWVAVAHVSLLYFGVRTAAVDLARQQTRSRLTEFLDVAHRYLDTRAH